jgi:hypothetical protein
MGVSLFGGSLWLFQSHIDLFKLFMFSRFNSCGSYVFRNLWIPSWFSSFMEKKLIKYSHIIFWILTSPFWPFSHLLLFFLLVWLKFYLFKETNFYFIDLLCWFDLHLIHFYCNFYNFILSTILEIVFLLTFLVFGASLDFLYSKFQMWALHSCLCL